MENIESLDDNVSGFGLTAGEIQTAARRQFVGSLVAALVIAIVAGATAFRPSHNDLANAAPHRFAGIQQPSLAMPGQRIAAITRRQIELP